MPNRVAYVDGLRAIAVLSVVFEHAASYRVDPHSLAGSFFRSGMHGVDLFFVISGFCLSFPALAKLHQGRPAPFDIPAFAARRLVRILPPYYIAIAILAIAALVSGAPLSVRDLFTQMFFLDRGGQPHMLNSSFWTLPVEFRWYALFPIALWLWTRSPRAFAIVAFLAACSTTTKAWSEDLLILPAFMLGIVAAHVHITRPRYAVFALPLFAACAIAGVLTTPADWNNYAYPVWQAAAFFFVIAAGSVGILRKVLASRVLRDIGVASYSVYLVHGPVVEYLLRHGSGMTFAAVVGICSGVIFWYVAERPFVQGAARALLLAEFDRFLPRWFTAAGISSKINLANARKTFVHASLSAVSLPPHAPSADAR